MTIQGQSQVDQGGAFSLLGSLPDEILVKIFSFIPKPQVITYSAVSKRFYQIIKGPDLYRKDVEMTIRTYREFLQKQPEETKKKDILFLRQTFTFLEGQLKKYSLDQLSQINANVLNQGTPPDLFRYLWSGMIMNISSTKMLASLRIAPSFTVKPDLNDNNFDLLLNTMSQVRVKAIHIPGPLPANQLDQLVQMLESNELSVKYISIDGFNHLHSKELLGVFKSLNKNNQVKGISTTNCITGVKELAVLLNSMKSNNTLESLSFTGFVISDEGLELLAQTCTNTSIKKLVLSQYIEVELRCLCSHLQNSTLETLAFRKGYISEVSAETLVDTLEANPSIKELDLMFNQITETALAVFNEANRGYNGKKHIKFFQRHR